MTKFIAVSTALMAAVSALPWSQSTTSGTQSIVAKFDNTNDIPLVATGPINIYQNIFWQGMSLAQTVPGVEVAGVKPASSPNIAAFGPTNVATLKQGQPSMKAKYEDSITDRFDLKSFYYACVSATKISAASLPLSCKFTIRGYPADKASGAVVEQDFTFKPEGLLSPMRKAYVSNKFRGMEKVDFIISPAPLVNIPLLDTLTAPVTGTVMAGVIDSIDYDVHFKKHISY